MQPYIKKYIVTGAPGTGKTTLINALEKEYPCLHEVSREVIAGEQAKGGRGMPWRDVDRFTELVYKASIKKLHQNPQALFTDRSMLDLIAYLNVQGRPIPSSLEHFPYQDTFHKKVFFAPTWKSIYRKDEQRPQDFDHCVALEESLANTYQEKGFEIIRLPEDTVAKRVSVIQETLHQK